MSVSKRNVFIQTGGTHAEPEVLKLGRIKNISMPRSRASSEHDFRNSDHTKTVVGNIKYGLEFELTEKAVDPDTDPVLVALMAAAESDNPTRFFVLRGDFVEGVKGTQGYYNVSEFPMEDDVNNRTTHTFTLTEADHEEPAGTPFDVQSYTVPAQA